METLIQRKRRALRRLVSRMDDPSRKQDTQKCMAYLNHLDRRIKESL